MDEAVTAIAKGTSKTKTDVVVELIELGLAQKKEICFALLGDPKMQDMHFPTGAQLEAAKIAE